MRGLVRRETGKHQPLAKASHAGSPIDGASNFGPDDDDINLVVETIATKVIAKCDSSAGTPA